MEDERKHEQEQAEKIFEDTLKKSDVTKDDLKDVYQINTALNAGEVDKIADLAADFLRSILHCFGEDSIEIKEYESDTDSLILDVTGGNLAVLIGRHGSTLDALQKLLNARIRKEIGFYFPVHIDLEGYKDRRADAVSAIALRMADKAQKLQKKVHLKPMNSYERRIVHMTLLDEDGVITKSEGRGALRHIVIIPGK